MTIGIISIIVGVVLLVLLKLFFKEEDSSDQSKEFHGFDQNELFKEEPDVDPSWSVLPGNVWQSDNN